MRHNNRAFDFGLLVARYTLDMKNRDNLRVRLLGATLATAMSLSALTADAQSTTPPPLLNECRIIMPMSLDFEARESECAPLFAVKTNLLYDAFSAINIGIEVPIGNNWSVGGDWIFPWWLSTPKQWAFQVGAGDIEGRYWFGYHPRNELMTRWFVGTHLTIGYYDWERDKEGKQGEFWSVGITGGYAHRIGCFTRLEYTIGVGFVETHYRKYEAQIDCQGDWKLLRTAYGHRTMFGLTKAEISLVWMWNRAKPL